MVGGERREHERDAVRHEHVDEDVELLEDQQRVGEHWDGRAHRLSREAHRRLHQTRVQEHG